MHGNLPPNDCLCRVWAALHSATSASCLALFVRGRCLAYLGWAAPGLRPAMAMPGPLCTQAMKSGTGNYLANLQLFPGEKNAVNRLRQCF